jgi:hypothetical protein
MFFSSHRCHLRLHYINVDYDSIISQNYDRPLFNEILVKFTYLVGMIADQNFYDIFFILRLQLRPKVKIAPTV